MTTAQTPSTTPPPPHFRATLEAELSHTLNNLLQTLQSFRSSPPAVSLSSSSSSPTIVPSDSIPERTEAIKTAVQSTFQAHYEPQVKTTYYDLVTIVFKRWMFEFVSHQNQAGTDSTEQLLPQLFDLLDVAIACTEAGCGDDSLPLTLVEDLVDILTIDGIEALFEYLDKRRERLIAGLVPQKGKGLVLLRFCTEILRRLSKSKNLMTCGNVLLWMAHVYPLSERSGVNLRGEFNVDNVTHYEFEDEDHNNAMEVDLEDPAAQQEYESKKFYKTFWNLQNFFRNPPSLHRMENFNIWRE
ncbi:hypothetical protein HK097_005267, partial [Rhizophlyctis rosea]